jgi:hypothetical protein
LHLDAVAFLSLGRANNKGEKGDTAMGERILFSALMAIFTVFLTANVAASAGAIYPYNAAVSG